MGTHKRSNLDYIPHLCGFLRNVSYIIKMRILSESASEILYLKHYTNCWKKYFLHNNRIHFHYFYFFWPYTNKNDVKNLSIVKNYGKKGVRDAVLLRYSSDHWHLLTKKLFFIIWFSFAQDLFFIWCLFFYHISFLIFQIPYILSIMIL